MKYKSGFDPQKIHEYAERYNYSQEEKEEAVIKQTEAIQSRGYLTKSEFETVVNWKAPRSLEDIQKGCTEDQIKEASASALKTEDEWERIAFLKRLDGVGVSIASAILHFYHKDRYPILDSLAFWSLDLPNRKSYKLWLRYTRICRQLADENKVDMRTLDRALWQYAKEKHQRS